MSEANVPMSDDEGQMGHEWGEGCVCGPTPGAVKNEDGSVTFTLRHHSLDGHGWTEALDPGDEGGS